MQMRTILAALMAALMCTSVLAPAVSAAVNVNRSGDENPMKEVAKSTIYGGVAGLFVGLALAVAQKDNDNDEDLIRIGFAGGTLFGLGMGIYWVGQRPQPSGALEFEDGRWHTGVPGVQLAADGGARVSFVRMSF
jgi:hypothetical protein